MMKFCQAYENICKKDKGWILGVEATRVDMGCFARCAWTHIVVYVHRVHLGGLFAGVRAI